MESLNPKHLYLAYDENSQSDDILHEKEDIKTPVALIMENRQWLIKRIYKSIRRYRKWIRVIFSVFLVVAFFAISMMSYKTGFHQGIEEWERLRHSNFNLKQAVGQYRNDNQQLRMSLTELNQQLTIKSMEYDKLAENLNYVMAQNADLKEDMRLYHSVLGIVQDNYALIFKSFHIYQRKDANQYGYQLILSSALTQKKWLQGEVIMSISGKLNDKLITIPVRYLPKPITPQNMRIKFKQFQTLSGELFLPQGFSPRSVNFIVKINGQQPGTVQKTFPWYIQA